MSNKTPKHVAEQATQKGALDRGSLTLIGIAGGEGSMRALIMVSTGRVVTAKLGERSSVGTVIGIDKTRVILRRGGNDITLEMPS